jgi:hypothetical protein
MSTSTSQCLVFDAAQLLPEAWRTAAAAGPLRAFNPGLLADGPGWILAYRVVAPDGQRRIALCRLDAAFAVVAGSVVPFSDTVRFRPGVAYPEVATRWFADPRLYRFDGRVFIYWNSGWHEPRNYQFVQELDPLTLQPRGHARELVLRSERQKLEKNWTLFAAEGRLHIVYSILPQRVLSFSFAGEADIVCDEFARMDWTLTDYPACHGGLRGGTPPVFAHGRFWCFGHSVHDGPNGYQYKAAAYAFAADGRFAPALQPQRPLALANPFGGNRTYARLNPAVDEVIYPCGAASDGARWIISYGINDEYCALAILPHPTVLETLRPIDTTA